MGAALASYDLSDPQRRQLLGEYVNHSRKTADECAHIFRGSLSMYDDEQNDSLPSSLSFRKPAYPRHIHLTQFEEIFGMLVADPEPHFNFFQGKILSTDAKPKAEATVCAHRVFCGIALLMRADLHSKVDFILRLYADIAGDFTAQAKSSLLKDVATTVEAVLELSDSIPSSVLASVEKTFWSDEEDKLMTVLELYDVCLTNPQISGMLHSVHALIEDFSSSQRQEIMHRREINTQTQQKSIRHGGDGNSAQMKSVTRTMSSAALPQPSRLWDFKAGDYGIFWLQPELLRIRASDTCAHALEQMARTNTESVLVIEQIDIDQAEKCQSLGLVTTDKLLLYFLHVLVPNFQSLSVKPYEHTRTRAEDAIRQFGGATLRDVVRFYSTERSPLVGTICEDEAFFSVYLRFAYGESSVAVAQNYSSTPDAVLGCLTVFDMLTWIDEDLALLKGKEHYAVAAFPQFFYAPARIDPVNLSASVCEGLVEMASRKLSGIIVETTNIEKKILSATVFRDLFPISFSALSDKNDKPGPLLRAVATNTAILPSASVVFPDASIAKVIQEMIDKRTRRVIIQRRDGLVVGAVRASDIFLLLLRTQYSSLR